MNSGLTIFTSNQLEILAAQLTDTFSQLSGRPLCPEIVLVQSRGMERWLSFHIARQTGICANFRFPFPNSFLNELFQNLFPDLPPESPFDPDTLTFRIMKLLPHLLERPAFVALRNYLADDRQKLKLFQLSEKIADLFDQYLVFRPDLIFRWEKQDATRETDEQWQAELWRALTDGCQDRHRAFLQKELIKKINSLSTGMKLLPPRIAVFGVSYLPPYYLQALVNLSNVIAVNLFVLNPCREYWADILSDREIHRTTRHLSDDSGGPEALYLERGNRLLASLGVQGRDFLNFISEINCQWVERFELRTNENLLGKIQADIFYLRDNDPAVNVNAHRQAHAQNAATPSASGNFSGSCQPRPKDESIQIHICHSAMREIEVLHDRLLSMFEADPDLTPADICVMVPDIESYAPYIQAVFATQVNPKQQIPFNIADQSVLGESRLIDSFLALLDLKDSRFPVGQIVDLLEAPGISARMNLSETEIALAVRWIRDLNIRWGADADNRHRLDLPVWSENTWKAGIERLLLGLALPPRDDRLYQGILPYEAVETADTEVLGRLLHFLKLVFDYAGRLAKPRTLERWQTVLVQLLDDFIEPNSHTERELQVVRDIIDKLGQQQGLAEFDARVELELVRAYINHRLQLRYFGSGFISGGITFCAMLPMRSIPFDIVCLIGMNSTSFPRDAHALDFDLIRRYPRPGDRQRRNDDRYLFLEAILSARQILYISYVGQSIADNTRIPPSVLVSELIDTVTHNYGVKADQLSIRHPLQAFSKKYFDSERDDLFSYSEENCKAAAQIPKHTGPTGFIVNSLEEAEAGYRNLDITQLCRFFINPARYLLQNRLDLYLTENRPIIPDTENFSLSALDGYAIRNDLLAPKNINLPFETQHAFQKARGRMPIGSVGQVAFSELYDQSGKILAKRRQITDNQKPCSLDIDIRIGDYRITGSIPDMFPGGRVAVYAGKKRARPILSGWLMHLVFCAASTAEKDAVSRVLFADTHLQLARVARPAAILEQMLSFYWQGLHRPLAFFPETAMIYAQQVIHKATSEPQALQTARARWLGSEFSRGEIEDVYFKQCFGKIDPLDEQFRDVALEVYRPLFEAMIDNG